MLDDLSGLDKADDQLLFSGIERLRYNEKYNLKDPRPLKHRVLQDAQYVPIKNEVRT
jgi:hypothetical protein